MARPLSWRDVTEIFENGIKANVWMHDLHDFASDQLQVRAQDLVSARDLLQNSSYNAVVQVATKPPPDREIGRCRTLTTTEKLALLLHGGRHRQGRSFVRTIQRRSVVAKLDAACSYSARAAFRPNRRSSQLIANSTSSGAGKR